MQPTETGNFSSVRPSACWNAAFRKQFFRGGSSEPQPLRLADLDVPGALFQACAKSRETIYGASVRAAAERATEARNAADLLACVEAWMTGSSDEALKLQRPIPYRTLMASP